MDDKIYIFKRMRKSGRKSFVKTVDTPDEARRLCIPHNNSVRHLKTGYWLEWTMDKDYISNR